MVIGTDYTGIYTIMSMFTKHALQSLYFLTFVFISDFGEVKFLFTNLCNGYFTGKIVSWTYAKDKGFTEITAYRVHRFIYRCINNNYYLYVFFIV